MGIIERRRIRRFNPGPYFDANYRELGEEDSEIYGFAIQGIYELGLSPNSCKRIAIPAGGPNMGPAVAAMPFLQPGGNTFLGDVAPENLRFQEAFRLGVPYVYLDDQMRPTYLDTQKPWEPVAKRVQELGKRFYPDSPEAFDNLVEKARRSAIVEYSDAYKPQEGKYDLSYLSFVSRGTKHKAYNVFLAQARSLQIGGIGVATEMLGSRGYSTAGLFYREPKLTGGDIKSFYARISAELGRGGHGLECKFYFTDRSNTKVRKGYSHMSVVVFRRLR